MFTGYLQVIDEVRKVTEGDLTVHYITIRKNFTAEFPVVLDIQTGGFGEFNGPKDGLYIHVYCIHCIYRYPSINNLYSIRVGTEVFGGELPQGPYLPPTLYNPVYTVEPLYNGHLWGTMFWPLYRGGLC